MIKEKMQESRSSLWWGFLGLTMAGVSAVFVWKLAVSRPNPSGLPLLGRLQDFALTDEHRRPLTRQDFLGKTSIVDFIYTECRGQCPMMSQKMSQIQALLPKETDIQLVSVSVDPDHDTPTELSRYADRYHAMPGRWRFASGTPESLRDLSKNFKLAFPGKQGGTPDIDHSSRFVLVDAKSDIRGYYDGTDEQDIHRLVKDVSALSPEAAP